MSKLDRFKQPGARRASAETDAEQTQSRPHIPGGHAFRRQVEIGPYRADFGSLLLKLLIEIDGLIHEEPARKDRDRLRDNWLEKEGYRVIRFSNHDVTTDMNAVLSAIELAVEDQKRALSSELLEHPTPALSRRPSPSSGG